jgi:hypothetical protein
MYVWYNEVVHEKGEQMNKEKRKEYLKEYQKDIRRTVFDLKASTRQKLDKIVKRKDITMMQWITEHIENDYNEIK